jgi:Fur family peroxide stress response transcriptional regulator
MALYNQSTAFNPKAVLTQKGIRPLTHRVAVFRYLLENPTHPTADEIYSHLSLTMDSISRTTVYNVLNLLVENKVVKEIGIEKNEMRYDANTNEHIHFKCLKCTGVYDLHSVEFPTVRLPKDFESEEIQINIIGQCPTCSR